MAARVFLPWHGRSLPWVVWLFVELSVMVGRHTGPKRQMGRIHHYDVEERPPGDDNYTWAGGGNGPSSNSRRHVQRPMGAPHYPPPPTLSSAPTHQHVAPPKVKLPPFWAKDPLSWFTLVESAFNGRDMVDSRLRFDLILPALPEEVIEQIHGVLHAVEYLDLPYMDLKARLLKLFTPKPADNCLKLINSLELSDRRPIQLMEAMLALLPPSAEELADAVAVLNVQPKCPQHKKTAAKGGKGQGKLCHVHQKYGDQMWKCADPRTCTWSGNE